MSTQQTTKKTTGYEPFQIPHEHEDPGRHARIGLDGMGAIHHVAEHENRVIVIKGGEIDRVQELAPPPERDTDLTAWIEHVDDLRGWVEIDYMTQTQFFERLEEQGAEQLSEIITERNSK